jgi:hypothetical protein
MAPIHDAPNSCARLVGVSRRVASAPKAEAVEALSVSAVTGERSWDAELCRLKGDAAGA